MFREIRFYDNYTATLSSPWWLFALLGGNFILLGILILIFPELLAWLVAAFLIFDGALLLGIGWQLRRLKRRYERWRDDWWLPE